MRQAAGALATLAAAAGLAFATTGTAYADAYGAQPFGGGEVPGAGEVPSGVLEHQITGSGLTVDDQWAEFESVAPVCNWEIEFHYIDAYNTTYHVDEGTLNPGCAAIGNRTGHQPGTALQTGAACAVLKYNGTEVARQCHSLF